MTKLSKKEFESKIQELFFVLMNGTRLEIKAAKKEIERFCDKETELFKRNAHQVLEYLPQFDQINKTENQAAFASGLNLFFLVLGDEYFDTLKNFTLKLTQHPNGHVREAIRKTADWLYISLTSRISPFVYPLDKELTPKQKTEQKKAKNQYKNYLEEIEDLIDKYSNKINNSVECVDELKPSVYKSLQFLWNDLTRSQVCTLIHDSPIEITEKRKEIEQELLQLLKQTKSNFDLEHIKEVIYNEQDNDDLMQVFAMFDRGGAIGEMSNILELVNDAWNYFPHKCLAGLCPMEKLLESQENEIKRK